MPDTDPIDQALRRAAAEIRSLRAQLAAGPSAATGGFEPIAVVGMACRLPGADSPEELWQLMLDGRDAISELPSDRGGGRAGVLAEPDGFDAEFFGIGDAEAQRMDPQQRLVLECAVEALERSGQPLTDAPGGTGVYLGVSHQDYLFRSLAAGEPPGAYLGLGNARALIANRVSYHLGLTGPSLAVDTACSSSLTALHLACQALQGGDCRLALAGGVNLILDPISSELTAATLPQAPDGALKALSAAADGMVRGEGVGVVVLKLLRDAVADGDRVLVRILATACNSDGASNGLTAPNPTAQARLLRRALSRAGLTPDRVGLLELHATGTPLGDPIEVAAVAQVYGTAGTEPCLLGSVKANLGHLEAAAGVASLIKAAECVRTGVVPAQIHLAELNPHIELADTRLRIPREAVQWPGEDRIAGVSSFGFGGSNAHVLLAGPPAEPDEPAHPVEPGEPAAELLLPLSARTPAALAAMGRQYGRLLAAADPDTAGRLVAATARHRGAHRYRWAVTAAGVPGLLDRLAEGCPPARAPVAEPAGRPVLVFGAEPRSDPPADGFPPVARRLARQAWQAWQAEWPAGSDAAPSGLVPGRAEIGWQLARAAAWQALLAEPAAVAGTGWGALTADLLTGALTPRALIERLQAGHPPPDGWVGRFGSRSAHHGDLAGVLAALTGPGQPGWLPLWIGPAEQRPPDTLTGEDRPLAALAALWTAGAPLDWTAVYPGRQPYRLLPTYPWQHRRYWPAAPAPVTGAPLAPPTDLLKLLVDRLAHLLAIDPSEVDVDVPARELDVDSLAFVEFKARIEAELAVVVPISDLLDGASLRELADRLTGPSQPAGTGAQR